MLELVLSELDAHGVKWSAHAVRNVKKHIDYAEYGGAPLLGVNGICIVGHGRSSAKAVRNAVTMAARAVNQGLLEKLS